MQLGKAMAWVPASQLQLPLAGVSGLALPSAHQPVTPTGQGRCWGTRSRCCLCIPPVWGSPGAVWTMGSQILFLSCVLWKFGEKLYSVLMMVLNCAECAARVSGGSQCAVTGDSGAAIALWGGCVAPQELSGCVCGWGYICNGMSTGCGVRALIRREVDLWSSNGWRQREGTCLSRENTWTDELMAMYV